MEKRVKFISVSEFCSQNNIQPTDFYKLLSRHPELSIRQALTTILEDENIDIDKCIQVEYEDVHTAAEEKAEQPVPNAENYTPKLGDKFRDTRGAEWELTSLTGALPFYTDDCAISSDNGGYLVTKNISYSELLDTSKYTRIEADPEQQITADEVITDEKADYVPKIGDVIDMGDEYLTISDISGNMITFTENETLFANTSRMTIDDFLSQEFTVVEETEKEIAEDTPDVPLEHIESDEALAPETETETADVPLEHPEMDKENPEMRKYIAQRAELLGAIRLPNNAFKKNAGTEVTSDILFFQKRERPIEIKPDEIEWLSKGTTPDGFSVNNYFVQHPEMVLGTIAEANQIYGPTENTQVLPIEGADLKTQLAEAVKNIQGTYTPQTRKAEKKKEADEVIPAPANSRTFSYYAVDSNVYYRGEDENMSKVKLSGENLKRMTAMIELRDNVRELLDMQLNNVDGTLDTDISDSRAKLNEKYDAFVEKYGHFDDKKNVKLFKGDDGYNFLTALETKGKEEGEYAPLRPSDVEQFLWNTKKRIEQAVMYLIKKQGSQRTLLLLLLCCEET